VFSGELAKRMLRLALIGPPVLPCPEVGVHNTSGAIRNMHAIALWTSPARANTYMARKVFFAESWVHATRASKHEFTYFVHKGDVHVLARARYTRNLHGVNRPQ
jgi:hypothetical protein